MLSKIEVQDAIRAGDIRIGYSYGVEAEGPVTTEWVDPGEPDARSTVQFDANFSGNRLSLTLGPLVKSNSRPHVRAKYRFKTYRGVTDLRKTNGEYKVRRGESITVNSNEYVALSASFGAMSLPRLSLATEGLVLGTSYIDPLWRGVLVLQLVNTNSRTITLKVGEKIAATHFYEVATTGLTDTDATAFIEKSHHYGLTWTRILEEERDPFPQRKRPRGKLDNDLWDFVQPFIGRIVAWGITGAVVIGAVFVAGQVSARFGDLPDRVTKLESRLNSPSPTKDSPTAEPTPSGTHTP